MEKEIIALNDEWLVYIIEWCVSLKRDRVRTTQHVSESLEFLHNVYIFAECSALDKLKLGMIERLKNFMNEHNWSHELQITCYENS